MTEPEVWARPATADETPRGARVVVKAAEAAGWAVTVTYARGTYVFPKKPAAVVDSVLLRMSFGGLRAAAHWLDGGFDDAYAWGPQEQLRKVGVNNLKHLLAATERWPAVPAAPEPTPQAREWRTGAPVARPVVAGSWGTVHAGDVVRGADQRPWRVVERGPALRWAAGGDSADFTMDNAERGEVTARRKLTDPCDVLMRLNHADTAAAVGALVGGGLAVEILREQLERPHPAPCGYPGVLPCICPLPEDAPAVELFRGVGCGDACGDGHADKAAAIECRAGVPSLVKEIRVPVTVIDGATWPATQRAERPCDDPFCGPGGCGWEPVHHVNPAATTPKERTRQPVQPDPFETPSASNADPIRNGRYHLPDPYTGEPTSYQRVTNLVKLVADNFGIVRWEKRMIAYGMSLRPDLVTLASALDPNDEGDKATLNDVAKQALAYAKSKAAANMGTALHKFTERIDRGETLDSLTATGSVLEDLRAYVSILKAARMRAIPEYMERVVVNPKLGVAGRIDRLMSLSNGSLSIEDLKTGKELSYSWLEIVIQMASYANATHMWTGRPWPDAYEPMPAGVDRDRALITWLPLGQATAHVYGVNLIKGWEWAQTAVKVREMRAEAAKGVSWLVAPTDQSTVALHLVSRAGSREELAELWESFNRRNLWTAEVDAAAQATFARLQTATV